MKIISAAVLFVLVLSFTAHAELNAKAIDYIKVRMVHSGTLAVSGDVKKANITQYIPQDGVISLDVSSSREMTWSSVYDKFGNRMILMEWERPGGTVSYRIETVLENGAKHSYEDMAVGTNDFYLQQTKYVKIDDTLREVAYPYEKSLRRAAELTKFVYDYMEYDLKYVGRNLPSDVAYSAGRGVCVEHANLLAALLRANGIPARYIVGYAYSPAQEALIGHTWVEVLRADGTWVPLDPTWLQAGYLDATHITGAALLDNSQIDTLMYLGGDINWTRNDERFDILEIEEKNMTSIITDGTKETSSGGYGYVKATVNVNECTIVMINALSCRDFSGRPALDIYEPNRTLWACAPAEAYWFYKTRGNNYICPIAVYDQMSGRSDYNVSVLGYSRPKDVSITGPQTVAAGETFTLTASDDGIFYSKDFGLNTGRTWPMNIKKEGRYNFYLYDGGLYIKSVDVIRYKEFDISGTAAQQAALNEEFEVNLSVKNLLDAKNVVIKLQYTNQTTERSDFLESDEVKNYTFRMAANREGLNDLVITVAGDTLFSETIPVTTPYREKSLLDAIIEAIAGFFSWIRF